MTPEHTDMTGAARLREALERTTAALARMPDAGLAEGDPRYRWWYDEAAPALAEAREALAAVPEAPEPVYEWRAVAGYYCHHARSVGSMAHKDAARFIEERPADRHRVYVERRTAPGPWERVEEGTEQ